MNILDIQCFLSVAKHNSITQAAEELFLTRQTVSSHISSLEKEIGSELFIRTPSSLTLSSEGIVCYDFFTDVKKNWDYTRTTIHVQNPGVLRIGCDFSFDSGIHLTEIMDAFRETDPNVDIELFTDDSIFLINQLNDDDLDIAIIRDDEPLLKTNLKKYDCVPFCEIELVLLVSNHHPNSGKKASDYANEKLFIGNSTARSDTDFEKMFSKMLQKSCGIRFTNVSVLPNMDSVHSTVLFSRGMTIDSTDCGILKIPGQVQSFPLGIRFNLVAVRKKSASSAQVDAFFPLLSDFASSGCI